MTDPTDPILLKRPYDQSTTKVTDYQKIANKIKGKEIEAPKPQLKSIKCYVCGKYRKWKVEYTIYHLIDGKAICHMDFVDYNMWKYTTLFGSTLSQWLYATYEARKLEEFT